MVPSNNDIDWSFTHPYLDETGDKLYLSKMIAQHELVEGGLETIDTRFPTTLIYNKKSIAPTVTTSSTEDSIEKTNFVSSSCQKPVEELVIFTRSPILSPHPSPLNDLSYPTPRPTKLCRVQSEPIKRRSIFGHIQRKQALQSTEQCMCSSPPPSHDRSIRKKPVDLNTLLSPPKTAKYCVGSHFLALNELSPHAKENLPHCLPTPMKRFYSEDGRKRDLAGVYPLNSPKSILRSSSYGPLFLGSSPVVQEPDLTRKVSSLEEHGSAGDVSSTTLNLTQSLRRLSMNKMDLNREESSDSTTSSSTAFSSEGVGKKHLQFDPRVTVTEYEDTVPRYWVTEVELERFKMETVKLAQQYVLAHPDALAAYTQMHLDPVTNTMRRKALFSMPCLSLVDDDDDDDDDEQQEQQQPQAGNKAAKTHVKSILLVEQNKLILDALRLTLQGVFPEARFTIVESADDALLSYYNALSGTTQQDHGFDIVVADAGHPSGLMGSDNILAHELLESTSWSDLGSKSFSNDSTQNGLRLFDLIQILDDEVYSTNPPSSDLRWRPLLVGISKSSDCCIQKFSSHGADFVWSLPPPKLDQSHRDEMVSVLIKKRIQHL